MGRSNQSPQRIALPPCRFLASSARRGGINLQSPDGGALSRYKIFYLCVLCVLCRPPVHRRRDSRLGSRTSGSRTSRPQTSRPQTGIAGWDRGRPVRKPGSQAGIADVPSAGARIAGWDRGRPVRKPPVHRRRDRRPGSRTSRPQAPGSQAGIADVGIADVPSAYLPSAGARIAGWDRGRPVRIPPVRKSLFKIRGKKGLTSAKSMLYYK